MSVELDSLTSMLFQHEINRSNGIVFDIYARLMDVEAFALDKR